MKNIFIKEDLVNWDLSVDYNSKHKEIHWESQEGLTEVYEVSVSDKILKILKNPSTDYQKALSDLI